MASGFSLFQATDVEQLRKKKNLADCFVQPFLLFYSPYGEIQFANASSRSLTENGIPGLFCNQKNTHTPTSSIQLRIQCQLISSLKECHIKEEFSATKQDEMSGGDK